VDKLNADSRTQAGEEWPPKKKKKKTGGEEKGTDGKNSSIMDNSSNFKGIVGGKKRGEKRGSRQLEITNHGEASRLTSVG